MSSLFGSISISLRALMAQQSALQTTSDNIANVNTPDYARRRAVLVEDAPVFDGKLLIGNGVHVETVESLRDRVLELRINEETQQQGELDAFVGAMQQAEMIFSDIDNGLGAQIEKFFNSLTQLSTDAASIPFRQAVLTQADNLAGSIRSASQALRTLQQAEDQGIAQAVTEVNALAARIADVNGEVARMRKLGQDASAFEDRRTELVRQLSGLIDVAVVDGDDGLTISTADGASLVVGDHGFTLETITDEGGHYRVISGGSDITSSITRGRIGGLLHARDVGIAGTLDDLNLFASGLAQSVNAAHRAGYDRNGEPGGDFFSEPAATDAATNFRLVLSDPSKLAASGDGSIGDNANLQTILQVRDAPAISGHTLIDFYSSMVNRLGNDLERAKSERDAGDLVLGQLANQRAAVSGVSLDEEAANLIRYQRAFEAAARVISIVDELTQTAINLGRN